MSGAIALGITGGFLWTATEAPLPATAWAAAFLFLVVEHDVRSMRIPNWLTFGGLAVALAHWTAFAGMPGLVAALSGAGFALALLFLPFAVRWLGAGDVKAMMVFGAFWGHEHVLPALFWMIVAGGLLAIGLVAARGELWDLCLRWYRSVWVTLSTGRVTYFEPSPGSAATEGLPFAVAIGVGAMSYQLWGTPWA